MDRLEQIRINHWWDNLSYEEKKDIMERVSDR